MLERLMDFFRRGLWEPAAGRMEGILKGMLRRLVVAGRVFLRERLSMRAAALTYALLLAVVPVLAIVFAVAKGFGLADYIEERIMAAFANQPGVAETLMGFVDQYLERSRGGLVLGLGIVLLLWSVFSLADTVEGTFNQVWRVRRGRGLTRKLSDYTAAAFLLPVFLVLSSGLSIFLSEFADRFAGVMLLSGGLRVLLELTPFALMILFCTSVFLFVPNAKVRWRSALRAGIPAGIVMQLLMYAYIYSQVFISGYSAVYGSFAALPLLMLWMRMAWEVMLFGTCLCYVDQNMDHFFYGEDAPDLSRAETDRLSLRLMDSVCRRLRSGDAAPTFPELVQAVRAPEPVVWAIVGSLQRAGILEEAVPSYESDNVARYYALMPVEQITVGEVLGRLDRLGSTHVPPEGGPEGGCSATSDVEYENFRREIFNGGFADKKLGGVS